MGKIILLTKHNMILFFQKRALVVLSILFPIIFFVFFSLLFTNYDDIDKIPIGLIDQDQSILSEEVVSSLNRNDALKVMSHDLEESEKLLKNNRIEAIFILKDGFSQAIKMTDYEGVIDLVYLDKSNIGPALSDIVASDLMMPISIYKAANQSKKYEASHGYEDMFNKTRIIGEKLVEESFFQMPIISTLQAPNKQINQDINITEVLTVNTTIGYTLVVFSFVILFANGHLMNGWQSKKRLLIARIKPVEMYLADTLSIVLSAFMIIIVQVLILIIGLKIKDINAVMTIIISLSLHTVFLSQLVILLTCILQSKSRYQGIIAPILFVLGMLGGAFWSTELLSKDIIKVVSLSPIYHTLTWIKNSFLHISEPNYLYYIYFIIAMIIVSYTVYYLKLRKLRHP
ncbi:ABC transporter permease [Acidaminobacter sp. JC074]|uniref:ABC transporter permease n=1 Tax=Acidaminobacter sp. JC074 TaxID=2530199 RepID=UPI001F0ECA9E|nr:ABC transporter permease [Acidaminobacter sp. JC074]MCH4889433.1 ABC transporter permease [Acidaminobacter sp. JC074]